jgi:hypothetical protein
MPPGRAADHRRSTVPVTREEIEDAIDFAVRLGLVSEVDLQQRLERERTHSSRRQRRRHNQRRTELTLVGRRVIAVTSDDVWDRPTWVATHVGLRCHRS